MKQIFAWDGQKFIKMSEPTKQGDSFRIICEYGDWSPFCTMPQILSRIETMNRDYAGKKSRGFFSIIED